MVKLFIVISVLAGSSLFTRVVEFHVPALTPEAIVILSSVQLLINSTDDTVLFVGHLNFLGLNGVPVFD